MHFLFIIISLIALLICNRANALTNYNDPSSQQHQNQHQLERRRSDHSGQFSGRGTWFEPGEGACGGAQANQGSMIVALNQEQYGNMNAVSRYCGRRIKISYAGKTVHAMIQDACPGCPFGALDMSPAVFNKLAAASVGVIQVTWQFTDGDDGGDSDKHVAAKHVVAKKEKAQHRTAKEALEAKACRLL
ncbi:hypothetical protein FRB98_005783 [Tulasnella sp. 332]|nr:hypothetical protein FRB98_005783 [Tulasnella sp. 332]